MSELEREAALRSRIKRGGSWRRPPVWDSNHQFRYLLSSACYEHSNFIGFSSDRMDLFEEKLLQVLQQECHTVYAHVILPNHYHVLIESSDIKTLRMNLGKMHGRFARLWNLEENCLGRKIFHGTAETLQKSENHFFASMNYVHHNPVKHGYVKRWQDWPWSSAENYLKSVGPLEAKRMWLNYPIGDYGKDWDNS